VHRYYACAVIWREQGNVDIQTRMPKYSYTKKKNGMRSLSGSRHVQTRRQVGCKVDIDEDE
jgi:hypothetical protein